MTATTIIDSLKFSATVADEQKDLFSPAHTLYRCVIKNPASRKQFTFSYQCNAAYKQPCVKECLYCLLSDASSVDYCADVADFLNEFGYIDDADSIRRGLKAFKSCQRTKKAIDRLFTEDEKAALNKLYENY